MLPPETNVRGEIETQGLLEGFPDHGDNVALSGQHFQDFCYDEKPQDLEVLVDRQFVAHSLPKLHLPGAICSLAAMQSAKT